MSEVALDGSQHKAPMGGEGTGPNPTDRAKSGWKWSVLMTAGASCGCRKLGSACDLVLAARCWLAGWRGMGVIYEVLLGLLVLRSRRDRLPFGEAEQARVSDSGDG